MPKSRDKHQHLQGRRNTNDLHQCPALQFYICIVYPYILLVLTIRKNNIAIKQLSWTVKMKTTVQLKSFNTEISFCLKGKPTTLNNTYLANIH